MSDVANEVDCDWPRWTARQAREQVTLGVDTHAEVHVAAAPDERGRLLGTCTIPTTPAGFAELVRWASQYGELSRVGMEGTGSFGVGLARWLSTQRVAVVEVDRPDRRTRRRRGKSDSVDAEAAARAVLAGTATAQPKAGTGAMEMMRTLPVAHQSAIKARTQTASELHALVITAPDAMRAQLRRLKIPQLDVTAAAFRRSTQLTTPTAATRLALKSIGMRYQHLMPRSRHWTSISTSSWPWRRRRWWRSKVWAPTSPRPC